MEGDRRHLNALAILRANSLSMVLEHEIERFIFSGELDPGDRVNENQLALRFGTSRGPIREALRSLEASGLVEQIPNRGVFIRRLETHQAMDVYNVRAVLFGYAGRLLAERASAEQVERLRRYLDEMDVAVAAVDTDGYVSLNFDFHEFIVEASNNPVLAGQYLGLVKQLRLYRARNLMFGNAIAVSNAEHHQMVDAIASRDPERAQRALFDHVDHARKRLLAAVEAGSLGKEQAP